MAWLHSTEQVSETRTRFHCAPAVTPWPRLQLQSVGWLVGFLPSFPVSGTGMIPPIPTAGYGLSETTPSSIF
jgi:hypothetical protein